MLVCVYVCVLLQQLAWCFVVILFLDQYAMFQVGIAYLGSTLILVIWDAVLSLVFTGML